VQRGVFILLRGLVQEEWILRVFVVRMIYGNVLFAYCAREGPRTIFRLSNWRMDRSEGFGLPNQIDRIIDWTVVQIALGTDEVR
jgi:hypothetical protein